MSVSIVATTHLNIDELVIILACLAEVNITDQPVIQRELRARLSKMLKKRAPEAYEKLIAEGKI